MKLPARVFACGFSLNKRRILRRFAGDSIVHCVRHARRIPTWLRGCGRAVRASGR